MKILLLLALLVLIVAVLSGCASRFLTPEQDREIADMCQQSCVVIDGDTWNAIQKILEGVRI